jgi:hypothetical protein
VVELRIMKMLVHGSNFHDDDIRETIIGIVTGLWADQPMDSATTSARANSGLSSPKGSRPS